MAFKCPACAANVLAIIHSIELLPDADNDELTLQTVQCGHCQFHGAAVYEESRRGALDSEAWRHHGHELNNAAWEALLAAIGRCPSPRNKHCTCVLHARLRNAGSYGIWKEVLPGETDLKTQFAMQYLPGS